MRGSSKLYGPLAAVAAALATAVASSAEVPTDLMQQQLGPAAPFVLYAAHPSMPVPPISSCDSSRCPLPSSRIDKPRDNSPPSAEQIVKAVSRYSLVRLELSRSVDQLAYLGPQQQPLVSSNLLRASLPQQQLTSISRSFSSPSAAHGYPSLFSPSFAASEYIRSWHSKSKRSRDNEASKQPMVTVVLLGWLGAKQKHLKKYAEWYTERGINAVTFVIPMSDVISLKVAGGKAEQQIEHLASHLLAWLKEEGEGNKEKHLFFHTFSNTGWLTYGVILERLLQKDGRLLDRIKGCVVDSAPVVEPDPQVWASGFSAAFLQKKSIASRKVQVSDIVKHADELRPAVTEQALMSMLEKFFSFFLELPGVKRRLSEVVTVLSKQQPKCPQLYFYSNADRVIPAKSVESFMEQQRKTGRVVKACNLHWSPHVDHFRSFPDVYSTQLNSFIEECLSQWSSHQKCG